MGNKRTSAVFTEHEITMFTRLQRSEYLGSLIDIAEVRLADPKCSLAEMLFIEKLFAGMRLEFRLNSVFSPGVHHD